MRYNILFIATVLILVNFSCRTPVLRNEISEGTWAISDHVYNAATVKVQDTGNTITVTSLDSDGLIFYFKKLPTDNGNYNIVKTPVNDDDVKIIAVLQDTTKVYTTTGSDNKDARITFANGKITLKVPSVEAENVNVSGNKITIEALLTEK